VPFRFLPEVALADVAYEATAATPAGLFASCADALTDVMVDAKSLRPEVTRTLEVASADLDRLLYDFLSEIIFLKDVDSLLFKSFSVEVDEARPSLTCSMRGEAIDRARHRLRNDVKAVTMHMFGIRRVGGEWRATVVLDI
jgi:protein archease